MPLKKLPLESKMVLENALGRQPVLECEGISGVRGQNVLFPHLQIPGSGVQYLQADTRGKGSEAPWWFIIIVISGGGGGGGGLRGVGTMGRSTRHCGGW